LKFSGVPPSIGFDVPPSIVLSKLESARPALRLKSKLHLYRRLEWLDLNDFKSKLNLMIHRRNLNDSRTFEQGCLEKKKYIIKKGHIDLQVDPRTPKSNSKKMLIKNVRRFRVIER